MRCPRAYHYNAMLKRESAEPKAGRAFGRVIHTVLKAHYNGQKPDIDALFDAEAEELANDEFRTVAFAKQIYEEYSTLFAVEPFTVHELGDTPIVEKAFALPLGTIETTGGATHPVIWTGIIDLVTVWPDSTLWPMDHKTSSMGGANFWAEFELSTAQLGYCWALKQLTGTTPSGYIINAIFTRKPTRTGKGLEFARQKYPFEVDDNRLAQFEVNTLHAVAEMMDNAERGYWPMHTGSCKSPYGMCEYHAVCKLPATQREALLNSNMYRNVTWDPLAL